MVSHNSQEKKWQNIKMHDFDLLNYLFSLCFSTFQLHSLYSSHCSEALSSFSRVFLQAVPSAHSCTLYPSSQHSHSTLTLTCQTLHFDISQIPPLICSHTQTSSQDLLQHSCNCFFFVGLLLFILMVFSLSLEYKLHKRKTHIILVHCSILSTYHGVWLGAQDRA